MGDFHLLEACSVYHIVGDVDEAISQLKRGNYGVSEKDNLCSIEFGDTGVGYIYREQKQLEISFIPDTQIEGGNPLKRFVKEHLP
ncbi:MAG: hypothetical protein ACYTEL_26490 [Planctomycetota bacterium]|jgi:hypothetical protein